MLNTEPHIQFKGENYEKRLIIYLFSFHTFYWYCICYKPSLQCNPNSYQCSVIVKHQDLDFGTQLQGVANDVTITPATGTGANGELAAYFTISGTNGNNFIASTVNASTTISNGGNNITVDTFLIDDDGSDATAASNPYNGTFGAGAINIYIGATCHIVGTEPAGTYSGTNTFQVVYN